MVLALAFVACGVDADPGVMILPTTVGGEDGLPGESEAGDDGEKLDIAGGGGSVDTEGGEDCACGPHSEDIYLLSDNEELWLFNPATLEATLLSDLSCPGLPEGDSTFSLGVARNGDAWVQFGPSGNIHLVDINKPSDCVPSGYPAGQGGFPLFGMAFVSRSADDPCDDLYAHSYFPSLYGFTEGENSGVLARIAPADFELTLLSSIDYNGGELTGTGDGRLFAFAGEDPAKLIEYDRETGAEIQVIPLEGLELTSAFSFAFWGGDFYFFTEADFFVYSDVTKLDFDGSDGQGMALTTLAELP